MLDTPIDPLVVLSGRDPLKAINAVPTRRYHICHSGGQVSVVLPNGRWQVPLMAQGAYFLAWREGPSSEKTECWPQNSK